MNRLLSARPWIGLQCMCLLFACVEACAADPLESTDPVTATAIAKLRSDPAFLKAVVGALKQDPAFLEQVAHSAVTKNTGSNDAVTLSPATTAAAVATNSTKTDPTRPAQAATDAEDKTKPLFDSRVSAAAGLGAPASGTAAHALLETSTTGTTATIAFARSGRSDPVKMPELQKWDIERTKEWTFALKVTSPSDKSSNEARFGSTTGLPGGLTVGGDYTIAVRDDDRQPTTMLLFCRKAGVAGVCTSDAVFAAIAKGAVARDVAAEFEDYMRHISGGILYNLHAAATHNVYKYFGGDVSKPALSDSKISWNVGGLAGLYYADRLKFIGLGVDFAHTYKEDTDKAACINSTAMLLTCSIGKLHAPKDQVHRIVSLQSRNVFALNNGYQLPVGVTVSHDLATTDGRHNNAIDVPVYLLHDKDSNFTGGVRMGWSTTDHFVGGVFVGTKFDLSPLSH